MAQFIQKPIRIEAWPVSYTLRDASNNWYGLPCWILASYDAGNILFLNKSIEVKLHGRWVVAGYTDWLIQGNSGEIQVMTDTLFRERYQPV